MTAIMETVCRLYIGNLPIDMAEDSLKQLFQDHVGGNTASLGITVKRGGFAFVECPDQSTADRAIDKLNGYNYMGCRLVVEPSVASAGGKRSNTRVSLQDFPNHVSQEDVEALANTFGQVLQIEEEGPGSFSVTFDSQEEAQQAVTQLHGSDYQGQHLSAEFAMERSNRGGRMGRGGRNNFSGPGQRQTDFPLRILVQSEMVGAIIGRQGGTIRDITQQTRARVDVHRKDNAGSLEKAITIYGNPENCTNACKKILEVMQAESESTNKGEIPLKMLAHNSLIGRIIGKGGATIKRIMEETDTKLTVSSINDINSFNLERIITIKGSIDGISQAESQISAKLRQSYENDLQNIAPQTAMFPGLPPVAMMSMGVARPGMFNNYYPPGSGQDDIEETTYLYIPNNAVGAIIGTKGTHIRNIIRFSGSSVKIAPLDPDQSPEQTTERKVTVVGSPESQWKAQYLIFEKMREEGFAQGMDEVRLTVEIMVPSSHVGRIIGKGGQNVRELQRVTGAMIKLPEQGSTMGEETTVHIIGSFYAVQSAQRRIRAMVNGPMRRGMNNKSREGEDDQPE